MYLSIDIETYSSNDLIKGGVYKYVDAEDFQILLVAYSFDGGPVKCIDKFKPNMDDIRELREALVNPNIIKTAFNANFERVCLSKELNIHLPIDQWHCTMVQAQMLGLPSSLDNVGEVLKLDVKKDRAGKNLIKYFCSPCKETLVNGGRTRNLPEHDPTRWEMFKNYCIRDVEVELAIKQKLDPLTHVTDTERQLYILDQKINDRGLRIDQELVNNILAIDDESTSIKIEEMKRLTGLENPQSVAQIKKWLAYKGIEVDTISKESVNDILEQEDNKTVGEVLSLRQEVSKTSIKKYTAMEQVMCKDGRVRGLLQYYGANRTGRWAGRLIQIQNLPRNYVSNIANVREAFKHLSYQDLELIYDDIPSIMSQLIRTAFIPEEGKKYIVADFSAIEARVLAWLANETWVLDTFRNDGKIYERTAARMFHAPVEKIVKGNPEYELRAKGKVATLACIAHGEQVLTDKGLVEIQNITLEHKLWDGISWVSHEGLIYKGEREVIAYEGLRATEDHKVWCEGFREPISFGHAAKHRTCLVQTGNGGQPIRLDEDNTSTKTLVKKLESLLCSMPVRRVRKGKVGQFKCSYERQIKRVSTLFSAKTDTDMARQKVDSSQATLRKPKRPAIQELWCERCKVQIQFCNRGGFIFNGYVPDIRQKAGVRQNRQQRPLRKRKYTTYNKIHKHCQSENNGFIGIQPNILALCRDRSSEKISTRLGSGPDNSVCKRCCIRKKKKLERNTGKVKVYDIRNAGPRNRFTVSGKLVHNCGYGGSVGALLAMGADKMGIAEDELKPIVDSWRRANPRIVQMWWDIGDAAIRLIKTGHSQSLYGLKMFMQQGVFFTELPSGRRLAYCKPSLYENSYGREAMRFMSMNQVTRKWEHIGTYGPKLVENIIQAISRDCLADSMLRLDEEGYKIVAHIHDEVIIEGEEGDLERVCNIMGQEIAWAKGLPLNAEGFEGYFYKKDD